jgi:hypothetical protein
MGKTIVRDYRPEDRAAVRRICFQTGLMGEPIADQYSDEESFADMMSSYYTDMEPQNASVAELDGKVVGYIFSCLDASKVWNPGTIAFRHALLRGTAFRPGTAGFYWRGLWDMMADIAKPRRPKFDLTRYPSHTHNNLLPEGRGAAVSKEFFFTVFDKLRLAGSPGLHGEALAENQPMIEFATKLGYESVGHPYPIPGMRLKNGGRVWVRQAVRDLTNWVPGAWKQEKKPRPAESAPAVQP